MIIHPFEVKMIPPHAPYDRETKPRPPNSSHFYSIHNAFVSGAQAVSNVPLSFDVISPLESRGMVAATLAANSQRWKGIIRIPQRTENGSWEDRTERLRQIKEKEGHYGELQILCVFASGHLMFALLNVATQLRAQKVSGCCPVSFDWGP